MGSNSSEEDKKLDEDLNSLGDYLNVHGLPQTSMGTDTSGEDFQGRFNRSTNSLLQSYGLVAQTVTWEDTARNKNSCFGPNISDMTLITYPNKKLMPVIRKPNFADVTCDLPIESFQVVKQPMVPKNGNEPQLVNLKTFLKEYKVLCERDSVVLTSTQCCVLPETEFAVQLFNYQSRYEDPAVLVILASKYGTSVRFVDRSNTTLMFNDRGTARWFSVERLENSRLRSLDNNTSRTRVKSYKEMTASEQLNNTLLMIQVPLKQKTRSEDEVLNQLGGGIEGCCPGDFKKKSKKGGIDMGQIGLGQTDGPFPSIEGQTIVRDENYPIRVTVQYYRVTDSGSISERDVKDIASQLASLTETHLPSGSLVTETTERKTEPIL